MIRCVAFLCVVVVLVNRSSAHDDADWASRYRLIVSQRAACGPNAVFLFLRMNGFSVNYEKLAARIAPNSYGTSLLDMKATCEAFGANVTVGRADGLDLCSAASHYPLIVHRRPFADAEVGHYFVLIGNVGHNVRFIDATSGAIHLEPKRWVAERLTGFYLERRLVAYDTSGIDIWLSVTLVVGCCVLVQSIPRWRCDSAQIPALVLSVMLLCPSSCMAEGRAGPAGDVRGKGRDAINILYLMLAIENHAVPYERVEAAFARQPVRNLTVFRDAADSLGLQTSVVRMTFDQICAFREPVMAVMDVPDSTDGCFVLVHAANRDNVDYVEGNLGIVIRLSTDEFLRNWTGIAVVPTHERWVAAAAHAGLGGLVGIGIGSLICIVARRTYGTYS